MQSSFFLPSKETWLTSLRENKPIIFIFLDKLCPNCYKFEKEVLSGPDVEKYLYKYFIPLFLDIQLHPDLYKRFNEENNILHSTQTVNGNILSTCRNLSPSNFMKNLTQYKHLYPQVTDPFENLPLSSDQPILILEEIQKFQEKTEIISEITLNALLQQYDRMYRGWTVQGQKTYPHTALDFLILFYQRSRDEQLYNIIIQTLRAAYRGLRDKDRFGLFECADQQWTNITCYKKTLENNVSAARTLFHAYQISNDQYYLDKVREIISFCLTDLWNPEIGLFNYGILAYPKQEFPLSQQLFLSKGNIELANLLLEMKGLVKLPIDEKEIDTLHSNLIKKLEETETRTGIPHIIGLENDENVQFNLQTQSAYLDLYIQSYSLTGNNIYQERAEKVLNVIIEHYYDRKNDLFKDRVSFPDNDYGPLTRNIFPVQGNAHMINNLVSLSYLVEKPSYRELAKRCITSYISNFGISKKAPFPPEFVIANQRLVESAIELIVIGTKAEKNTEKLTLEMKKVYDPFKLIQIIDPAKESQFIAKKFKDYQFINYTRPVAFIKVDNMISPPAFFPKEISKMLNTLSDALEQEE